MRALVRRDGQVGLEDWPSPRLENDADVLIQVVLAGICRTDVYVARGTLPVAEPRVLGHELAGVVLEAGPAAGFRPGDRVSVRPTLACGACAGCAVGEDCADPRFLGVHADGGFADQLVLPAAHVLRLPDDLPPRKAAYVEPVAAALAVLEAPLPRKGAGLVLGRNRIASLTMHILAAHGFANFRNLALDELPAQDGLYDCVIETEATPEALEAMARLLKPRGLGVLKSRPSAAVPFDVARAVRKNLCLQAVHYGDFARAVDLLSSGALMVDDLLGEAFPLEDFERALARAVARDAAKIFFAISPAEAFAPAPARAMAQA
jgi:L-iditol 2-dehydrogenase